MTLSLAAHLTGRCTTLVLAVLAVGALSCSSERDAQEGAGAGPADAATGSPASAPASDPVRVYLDFAATARGDAAAPLEAAEVANGLRALAGVVGTLDGSRPDVVTDLRAAAEHVLLNPASLDVAATVRDALVGAAMALDMAQPGASTQEAAEQLKADAPLTEQAAALRGFFQQAAAALAARAPERSQAAHPSAQAA